MEVINTITWGQIITILAGWGATLVAFVWWAKVQIATLRVEVDIIKEALRSSAQEEESSIGKLETQIGNLSRSFNTMKDDFGGKLYDMNTKVTEANTIIKVKLNP